MNCTNCTQPLIEGSRFCNNCGAKVVSQATIESAPARELLQELINSMMLTGMIAPNTYGVDQFDQLLARGCYAQAETDFNTDPFNQRPTLTVTAITDDLTDVYSLIETFTLSIDGNLLGYVTSPTAIVFVSADYSRTADLPNGIEDLEKALGGTGVVLIGIRQSQQLVDTNQTFSRAKDLLEVIQTAGLVTNKFRLKSEWASELEDLVQCALFRYYPDQSNVDEFISGTIYVGVPGKEVQINGATECVATLTDENWTIELSANRMAPSQFKVEISKFENYLGGTLELQR
jgi:hypothetical protein